MNTKLDRGWTTVDDAPSAPTTSTSAAPGVVADRPGASPDATSGDDTVAVYQPTMKLGPRIPAAVSPALLCAAIGLWIVALFRFDASAIGPYGLITAVGPAYYAAGVALAVSFAITLVCRPERTWLLSAQVLSLVLVLYATPTLAQEYARFPVTWLHAGFADFIGATGETLPLLDARFSWPGFFAAFGMMVTGAGIDSSLSIAEWAPVVVNIAALVCVALLARAASTQPRAQWLALWVYSLGNWAGQDYFAPQAVSYVLYLTAIVIVLRFFKSPPAERVLTTVTDGRHAAAVADGSWWSRLRAFGPDEVAHDVPTTVGQRIGLVVVLFALTATIAVSHQLTPVILTAGFGVLVLARRCTLRTLPVLAGLCFFAWFTLGAEEFWAGWLGDLLGEVGAVNNSLHRNVGGRIAGDPARLFVVGERIAFSAVLAGLAVVGFVRRHRAGYGEVGLALLGVSPLVVLAGNSYGGEAIIRAFFFSLPFMAIFIAFAVFPSRARQPGWGRVATVAVATMVALPLLIVARYGNESFEMITTNDFAAIEFVYEQAPEGSTVVALTNQAVWQYRRIQNITHRYIEPAEMNDVDVVDDLMTSSGGPSYLVITPNQEAWGELQGGYDEGWSSRLVKRLVERGAYRRVFRQGDAQVIEWRKR